jgi:hypothetical protein
MNAQIIRSKKGNEIGVIYQASGKWCVHHFDDYTPNGDNFPTAAAALRAMKHINKRKLVSCQERIDYSKRVLVQHLALVKERS